MKRKVLFVVALMLALSVSLAAMAYNGAYVHNPTTLKIASTDSALIAIKPGADTVGNRDATASIRDGVMYVNFGKGIGGQIFGLQPASEYTWNDLFEVTNNSEENLNYRITVGNDEIAKHIKITDVKTGKVVYGGSPSDWYNDFPSGQTRKFKVQIWLHQITSLADLSGVIQFNTYAK